jgi:hypothetical protein
MVRARLIRCVVRFPHLVIVTTGAYSRSCSEIGFRFEHFLEFTEPHWQDASCLILACMRHSSAIPRFVIIRS